MSGQSGDELSLEVLREKVVVITGAGSGLGAGLVTAAGELGMRIALADINSQAIRNRSEELEAQGIATIWREVDVRKMDDVHALAAAVYARWGETTVLINNAGIELIGNTWELPVERWHEIVDINLNGVFNGVKAFLPRMISNPSRAHIANVASVAALTVTPGTSAYSATKHACIALTESLAKELEIVAPHVVATVVIPGMVKSRIFESAFSADEVEGSSPGRERRIESMAERGMEPIDAARIIFRGIAEGHLRVHTHPRRSRELIDERYRSLRLPHHETS